MIDILPDKAREIYQIPNAWEAWTGLAIGYQGDPMSLPDNLKERDLTRRQRKASEPVRIYRKVGKSPRRLFRRSSLLALPACESGCTGN